MPRPSPLPPALALALLLAPVSAQAQWIPFGVPLCDQGCPATGPLLAPDGLGGAYFVWRDGRNYPVTDDDIYGQHLRSDGTLHPGWSSRAVPVCTMPLPQNLGYVASDPGGNALVVWADARDGYTTSFDIYAQKLAPDGTPAPGWAAQGMPVTRSADYDYFPDVLPDGAGGLYVAWWKELDPDQDIWVQRLGGDGLPAPGWPAEGQPVSAVAGIEYPYPNLVAVTGGVVVAWTGLRDSPTFDVFAVGFAADGTLLPGWPADGARLAAGNRAVRALTADEAGGFYLVSSVVDPGSLHDLDYRVHRYTASGAVAAGWPEAGLLVAAGIDGSGMVTADDGAGGLLLTWYDYRPPYRGGEIFALRVRPDATLAPGWIENGVMVSEPQNGRAEYTPEIAPDGLGGAYVIWGSENPGILTRVQHLTASGGVAPGWPPYGMNVSTSDFQSAGQIVADGYGNAIVCWRGVGGVYAAKFGTNGPVAAQVALRAVAATAGRVRLEWQASGVDGFTASVERAEEGAAFAARATVTADGAGRLAYEDRAVTPGARYGYRLRWMEGETARTTVPEWVAVPHAARLALDGLRPNPAAGGELRVAFALGGAGRATLELLDVAGRRVVARDLAGLGAGRHVVRLEPGAALTPGLYWLRLTEGPEHRTARAVVVR